MNQGNPVKEVFMVPVLSTGLNFYKIDDDLDVKSSEFSNIIENLGSITTEDDLILDSSVPCPNNCN